MVEKNLSPKHVNAKLLTEFTTSDEIASKSILATKRYIKSNNENTSDYFLSKNSEGDLVIPLRYKVDFTMPISLGDPGGKSRNIIYNIKNEAGIVAISKAVS